MKTACGHRLTKAELGKRQGSLALGGLGAAPRAQSPDPEFPSGKCPKARAWARDARHEAASGSEWTLTSRCDSLAPACAQPPWLPAGTEVWDHDLGRCVLPWAFSFVLLPLEVMTVWDLLS